MISITSHSSIAGVSKFLVPEKDGKKPVFVQSKPYNFHWPIRETIDSKKIAAGYGFTVIGGTKGAEPLHVFGSGINTDSQLGFHTQDGLRLQTFPLTPISEMEYQVIIFLV